MDWQLRDVPRPEIFVSTRLEVSCQDSDGQSEQQLAPCGFRQTVHLIVQLWRRIQGYDLHLVRLPGSQQLGKEVEPYPDLGHPAHPGLTLAQESTGCQPQRGQVLRLALEEYLASKGEWPPPPPTDTTD